jgi:hypothetical protein
MGHPPFAIRPPGRHVAFAMLICLLAGCRGIPVKVQTPEPLQVDVNIRVDIHQRKVEAESDVQAAAPTSDAGTSDEESRRRDRMGQIQSLKNSRLVGESRTGLLQIIRLPPGAYGQEVERAVAAENADRTELMRTEAARRRVPLATVEAEQATQWRERAFPGEWIEEPQPDKTWRWVQKRAAGAPSLSAEPPAPAP